MSLDKLMDAIGQIDPAYVEEAKRWKDEAGQRREKRQKKAVLRRRMLRGALPTAACLALILMGAFFVIQNGGGAKKSADGSPWVGNDYSNEDKAENPGNPNSGAASEEKNNQTADESGRLEDNYKPYDGSDCEEYQEYFITMNEIKAIEMTCIPEASAVAVTSTLSMEELQTYYGMAVQPSWLPEDMALSDYRNPALQPDGADQPNGAGQPDGSGQSVLQVGYDEAGNVVNDNNTLHYRNDTGKRELFLSVRTVEAGWIASLGEGQWKTTEIQDRPVLVGHYRDSTAADCYIAIFKKENVTFTIITKGFSKQELCKVMINEMQK